MSERRKEQRWPSYLGGRAFFSHVRSIEREEVLVRNFSASGAKLVISNGVFVPKAFKLEIPRRQKTYHARTQWRSDDEIGIKFQ